MKRNTFALVFAGLAAIIAVSLLVVVFLGEQERSGGHAAHEEAAPAAPPQREVTGGGYRLSVNLSPEAGTVGEVVTVQGRLTDDKGGTVKNVRFELVSQHLEDDVAMFKTTFVAPDGLFSWGNQFWDGTEHEIRITASPAPGASTQFAPLTLRRVVEVEPIAPGLDVQLRALVWLLVPVALGMAIGLPLGLRVPAGRRASLRPSPSAA